jgi:hypothetical protein
MGYIKDQRNGAWYWACDCDGCTISKDTLEDLKAHKAQSNAAKMAQKLANFLMAR